MRVLGSKVYFWPTLIALPALLTLLGLGAWQLERLTQKRALLAQVEARLTAPVEALPEAIPDPEALKFRRFSVIGRFHHDLERHMLAHTAQGKIGYQIITPLEEASGRYVLVNRGWVPQDQRDPKTRAEGQVEGQVSVTGIVRTAWKQGFFVPDNAVKDNFWFFGDLDAMARTAGLTNYAPVFLEADDSPNPGGLPIGGQTRLTFPNDHLQYAFTWFALALGLGVIYVLYLRQRGEAEGA